MGLSTKQVSSDHGLDWNQTLLQAQTLELPKPSPVSRRQQLQNMPAPEQLKCPRCDSSNTKFCYYNNYNKSQPRHFCKACKRHWTKGGTLRNVPVGGGRKNNKRLKSSKNNPKTASKSSSTAAAAGTNGNVDLINRVSTNNYPQIDQTMSQPMFSPPYNFSGKTPVAGELDNSNINNSIFLGSSNFPHFSTTSFEAINPCSISTSFQSPNVYNFTSSTSGDQAMDQDSIVTSILTNTTTNAMMPHQLNWQGNNQNTTTSSYWNWDDLDAFAAPTDLNIPWDDTEIKP